MPLNGHYPEGHSAGKQGYDEGCFFVKPSYHMIYIHPDRSGSQELAPFGFSEGCQRVIEPVSHRFFINQLQALRSVIDGANIGLFRVLQNLAYSFRVKDLLNTKRKHQREVIAVC